LTSLVFTQRDCPGIGGETGDASRGGRTSGAPLGRPGDPRVSRASCRGVKNGMGRLPLPGPGGPGWDAPWRLGRQFSRTGLQARRNAGGTRIVLGRGVPTCSKLRREPAIKLRPSGLFFLGRETCAAMAPADGVCQGGRDGQSGRPCRRGKENKERRIIYVKAGGMPKSTRTFPAAVNGGLLSANDAKGS